MSEINDEDRVIFEVCIDSVRQARVAHEAGADRLELCSGLLEGGVTPSLSLVREVVAATPLPVMCMVRPRGGNFQMTETELRVMEADIGLMQDAGASGVVFGVLNEKFEVDEEACRRLLVAARPLSVTFHRAIDVVADVDRAMQRLVDFEFDRVLTSGQAVTACAGVEVISWIQERFGKDIVVMPGAGVNPMNARQIIDETGVKEIHGSASSGTEVVSEPLPEGQSKSRRKETDPTLVRAIRATLDA